MNRRWMRMIAILFLLSWAMSACAVCGAQESAPEGKCVTFTDDLGRKVTIEKTPQRTAALIGSFADVWLLAGGEVCAAAEEAWDDLGLELPDAYHIGGAHSPNLELLLASDPDFVLASASTASNVAMREVLENAGIAVAYFDVDHFGDYLSMLDICTDITGRKDLYEQNGLAIQARIEAVRNEFATSPLSEHERTVLLLRASSGFVRAKGSEGTILGEMLADLGCINLADSDTSLLDALSVERVIRQEPYRIFVVTMGGDTQKAMDNLNSLMDENPAWGMLDAVEEGRLHVMERELFNIKPNARWAEAYEQLSEIYFGE